MYYNPFMPTRYLNPRASGLIVFGGGGGDPAPAPAPPSSDEEEEAEVEEEAVHMKEKKTEVEDPTNAMLWVYVDADGAQFGPFGRELMQGWYEGGMIPAKLCVRPSKREDLEFVAIDELFSNKQPFFGM